MGGFRRLARVRLACILLLCALPPGGSVASAQVESIDDFANLDAWTVTASDGVTASIAPADGPNGPCLRLDFDFHAGAGFCVVRRDWPRDLPANYRFAFALRGDAPDNNFECKLIDSTGENVWWVNRRALAFPKGWETVRYRKRHFRFAWGPSGGAPLERIAAIEFAIAAAEGGSGSVFIDSLTFEELPAVQPSTQPPALRFSSNPPAGAPADLELPSDGTLAWTSAPGDRAPWIEIDLRQVRELGGLTIDWARGRHPCDYDVSGSHDGNAWETLARVRGSNGGRDHVAMPDAEARRVRIAVAGEAPGPGVTLSGLLVREVGFSESPNGMFGAIAQDSPRGWFPQYLLAEQAPWTVVGVAGDSKEALLSANGAVEVDRGAWSIEPFLFTGDRLITWADCEITHALADGGLPIPSVFWRRGELRCNMTFLADGEPSESELSACYRVGNSGKEPLSGVLYLAIRPFQVLPPWHELGLTGGVSRIRTIERTPDGIVVNGDKRLAPWSAPAAFGAATFAQGDVCEYLALGRVPASKAARDENGLASAVVAYPFEVQPGEFQSVVVSVPLHAQSTVKAEQATQADAYAAFAHRLEAARAAWTQKLDRVKLTLPPGAQPVADTFRATQAYILINADGPAIQPGSRTYERSWIRDGALTSTALLATGHAETVKTFLEWYAKYQYADGKVPCVVDHRGPDPVPEHDSSGEFIYALLTYYRFTHDQAFLEAQLPNVVAAVDYLERLRNQRTTERYQEGSPIERACFGLVPESISHEGYSAKPMHSYWDDFFTVRGFADAAEIARILERSDLAHRFDELHAAHLDAVQRSLRLAIEHHHIDYLPGCVELGDFDATSTAIGVFPCDLAAHLPQPQLANTFDRYFQFCERRKSGTEPWENYTPYELRVVGTFVRLGQPERARTMLDFFMHDQRPPGWRQWGEVVWRDPLTPKFVGDMPHTWVGSEFLNALRAMFVYEDGDALVLLGGVAEDWLTGDQGARLESFPTAFGTLNLQAQVVGDSFSIVLAGDAMPPGGYRLMLPRAEPPQLLFIDGRQQPAPQSRVIRFPGAKSVVALWP